MIGQKKLIIILFFLSLFIFSGLDMVNSIVLVREDIILEDYYSGFLDECSCEDYFYCLNETHFKVCTKSAFISVENSKEGFFKSRNETFLQNISNSLSVYFINDSTILYEQSFDLNFFNESKNLVKDVCIREVFERPYCKSFENTSFYLDFEKPTEIFLKKGEMNLSPAEIDVVIFPINISEDSNNFNNASNNNSDSDQINTVEINLTSLTDNEVINEYYEEVFNFNFTPLNNSAESYLDDFKTSFVENFSEIYFSIGEEVEVNGEMSYYFKNYDYVFYNDSYLDYDFPNELIMNGLKFPRFCGENFKLYNVSFDLLNLSFNTELLIPCLEPNMASIEELREKYINISDSIYKNSIRKDLEGIINYFLLIN